MPDISIIIINYNVKYFLEACLLSVKASIKNIDAEVIIVDNNSSDGSCDYLMKLFPEFKFIQNIENKGFAKANNQAISIATGKYILLLNPDTIIGENTIYDCINFMYQHNEAGALGVHMIDGNGTFLKESKRALPTPAVSFYKIFGLAALFPNSKRFNHYHLGHLSKEHTHEIEVLSGAFMLLRSETIKKCGVLDEDYFMYGEDIDLSYKIIKSGYKNYYFPKARIIHFKGESTKKGSLNYVVIFYRAMEIFARKHFSKGKAPVYSFFINLAIYLRATTAILKRLFDYILYPVKAIIKSLNNRTDRFQNINILLIGSENETKRLDNICREKLKNPEIIQITQDYFYRHEDISEVIKAKVIKELVISLKEIEFKALIENIEHLSDSDVNISMLVPNSDHVISSKSLLADNN